MQIEGGCLCRAVRYGMTQEPRDVIHCGCRFCQRNTGSAFLVETLFSVKAFSIVRGAPRVFEHISEGSGKAIGFHFCGICGTNMWMTLERFPDRVGIFNGTLDDPNRHMRDVTEIPFLYLGEVADGTMIPAGQPC